MYKRVHKIGTKWFFSRTGKLLGYDIPPGGTDFELQKQRYGGDKLFAKKDKKIFVIYYGYFKQGNFYLFCKKSDCLACSRQTKSNFCPHSDASNNYKRRTGGYYIKTGSE